MANRWIQKTAAILERLPPSTSAGMQVLVDQVSPLRDLASVQKSVTKRLQKENEKLRNRLEKLEENVDETEQHGKNIKGKVNPGKSFPVFFTLDRSSEMM